MRSLFILSLLTAPAFAQWIDFSSFTGATNLSNAMNSKPAVRSGSGVPILTCTVGKDLYVDTAGKILYWCDAADHWTATVSTDAGGNITVAGTVTAAGGFASLGPYSDYGLAVPFTSGLAADRPECTLNAAYLASDTHALTICDGTAWSSTLNLSGTWARIFNLTAGTEQIYDSDGNLVSASTSGVTASGSSCTITAITNGIITAATCAP